MPIGLLCGDAPERFEQLDERGIDQVAIVGNLVFFSTLEQKTYAARVDNGQVVGQGDQVLVGRGGGSVGAEQVAEPRLLDAVAGQIRGDGGEAANQEPPDQVSRHQEGRPGVERPREGPNPYFPGAGCHSSRRLPSGSTAQPNLPYSLSSTWSITSVPVLVPAA